MSTNNSSPVVKEAPPKVELCYTTDHTLELLRDVLKSTSALSLALSETLHEFESDTPDNFDDILGLIRYIQQFRSVIQSSIT